MAAAIAYSTIFSLTPLLIVLIAIAGPLLGSHSQVENQLLGAIHKSAGASAADALRQIIANTYNKPRQGFIAQIVGWVMFVVGASSLFVSLQDALNAIWHVESIKGGWKAMARSRGASFGMILAVGFLLLVTFIANSAIAVVGSRFRSMVPLAANPTLVTIIDQVVILIVVVIIFALIFKVLPDVDLAWSDVWVGAAATGLLFIIGENLISVYLAVGGVGSTYGAAGSLLVALIWIYYSAMILLLGAEFTKVHAKNPALRLPSGISEISEQPAGVDPRFVGKTS
ncbi:MAG: YihY/virulence factor BrkB family protein [Candidatus Eremiobacteraeota bacterium]|nr:YihY/virulence factor BrkB family protein [Candidatus Eremiobacteraeota bacterium]